MVTLGHVFQCKKLTANSNVFNDNPIVLCDNSFRLYENNLHGYCAKEHLGK